MIDLARLVAAGIGPTQGRAFEKPLQDACEIFELTNPKRQAAFVGEYAYETGGFIHLEESLYYRDPVRITQIFRTAFRGEVADLATQIMAADRTVTASEAELRAARMAGAPYAGNPKALANRVYARRLGNGDEQSGDGWAYRGRGLCMATGRATYTAAAQDMGEPYLAEPDLVSQPADAVLVGGWYWRRYRLNVLADAEDIDGITRTINGPGMLGAKERRDLAHRCLLAFT